VRVYIELYEVLPPKSMEEADFIRIDVMGWDPQDVEALIKELEAYANRNYQDYKLQRHLCYHDEGGSCLIEELAVGPGRGRGQ